MKQVGRTLLIAAVVICGSVCTFGQRDTLRGEEIKAAVLKISGLIKSNYVFEKRGNEIAIHLVREHEEGKFNAVKSWTEFASLCTKILQDYSNDGHLYGRHDAKTVKEVSTATDQVAEFGTEDPFFHSREAREKNFGFDEVKVLKGNIGYIKLSEINISEKSLSTLFAAVEFVANTKTLILDLRDNGALHKKSLSLQSRRKHKAWGASPRIRSKISPKPVNTGDSVNYGPFARGRGLRLLILGH